MPYLLAWFLVGIGHWFLPNCYLLQLLSGLGLVGFLACLVCLDYWGF